MYWEIVGTMARDFKYHVNLSEISTSPPNPQGQTGLIKLKFLYFAVNLPEIL